MPRLVVSVALAQVPPPLPEQAACDGGRAAACTALGTVFAEGQGVPRDAFHAAQLYRKGCELGDAPGCMFLAEAYRKGEGARTDELAAVDLYMRACELKNGLACRSVGDLYTMGATGFVDGRQAGQWYAMGCALDDAQSCTAAGLWLERGEAGALVGQPTPMEHFQKGCEGGHLRACTLVAERYERGSDGLPKDRAKAVSWYAKACVPPYDPQGCRELGRAQLEGKLVTPDPYEGLHNLDRACYQNDAEACRYLSLEAYRLEQDSEALTAGERGCDLGDEASCRAATRARTRLMKLAP